MGECRGRRIQRQVACAPFHVFDGVPYPGFFFCPTGSNSKQSKRIETETTPAQAFISTLRCMVVVLSHDRKSEDYGLTATSLLFYVWLSIE